LLTCHHSENPFYLSRENLSQRGIPSAKKSRFPSGSPPRLHSGLTVFHYFGSPTLITEILRTSNRPRRLLLQRGRIHKPFVADTPTSSTTYVHGRPGKAIS